MDTFSPDIRSDPLFKGFNAQLKLIEFNCSLAYGTISDPQNVDKTAEEITRDVYKRKALCGC